MFSFSMNTDPTTTSLPKRLALLPQQSAIAREWKYVCRVYKMGGKNKYRHMLIVESVLPTFE